MSYDLLKWTGVPDILGGAIFTRIQKQICNLRSYGLFTTEEMEDPKKGSLPWQRHPLVLLAEMICSYEKWRHQHWFSFNIIHVLHLLSVAVFVRKTAGQKYCFQILSQDKSSIDESQKCGFGFDPRNPPIVWISRILDPFLDLLKNKQNPLWIRKSRFGFSPKNSPLSFAR